MKKLQNKVALVTGGSRGIGAAIAQRLAEDGADVAISYTSSVDKAEALVKELTQKGVRAQAFKADQSDPRQVEDLIKDVIFHFGQLDIFVNNAGVFAGGKIDDPETDVAALARLQSINVTSIALGVRAAVKSMKPGSRIILIGSTSGDRAALPGFADYCASKSALQGYTRGWARDLGPKGITVNTIQPGPIDTDMNPDNTDFADVLKAQIALGRYGKPEEVAAAVAFIASDESSFITGITLTVDGGFNA